MLVHYSESSTVTFPGIAAQWFARATSVDGGTAYSCGGSPGIAPGSHNLSFARTVREKPSCVN